MMMISTLRYNVLQGLKLVDTNIYMVRDVMEMD